MEGERPERKKTSFLYSTTLLQRLRRIAQRHHRSLNAEMEYALELYAEQQEREEERRDQTRDRAP